jgi:hypothetical protein
MQKNKYSDFFVHIFLLVCIAFLVGGLLFSLKEIKGIKDQKVEPNKVAAVQQNQQSSPTPVAVVNKVTTVVAKPEKKISYLNLNGTFTTQSTDWVDIKSTDTWIDLENEYGKDVYVDWDAAINTTSSGSKVFVRLYDVTHNIGVNGSDLESNATTSTRVASNRLYLWKGHNNYRVQIKSLNGIDATFSGGRIKIVY